MSKAGNSSRPEKRRRNGKKKSRQGFLTLALVTALIGMAVLGWFVYTMESQLSVMNTGSYATAKLDTIVGLLDQR